MFSDRPLRANGLQDYVPPFSLRRAQLIKDPNMSEVRLAEKPISKWNNNTVPNTPQHQQSHNYDNTVYSNGVPVHNSIQIQKSVDNGMGDMKAGRRTDVAKPFDAHTSLAANWPFDEAGVYRNENVHDNTNNSPNAGMQHTHNCRNYQPMRNSNAQYVNQPNQPVVENQQPGAQMYQNQTAPANQQQCAQPQQMSAQSQQQQSAQPQQMSAQLQQQQCALPQQISAPAGFENHRRGAVGNQQEVIPMQYQKEHQMERRNQPEQVQGDQVNNIAMHQTHHHHQDNISQGQQPMPTNQYLPSTFSQNTDAGSNQHLQKMSNNYNQVVTNVPASHQHSVPREQPHMRVSNDSAANMNRMRQNYHPMNYVHYHPEAAYMQSPRHYQQMPQVSQQLPHPSTNNNNNLASQGDVMQTGNGNQY